MMRLRITFIFLIVLLLITGCGAIGINHFDQKHLFRTGDDTILLTFDDGPGENTAAILDLLKERNLKAAFFVIGVNAEKYPELINRILTEGHILGNHTYSHRSLMKMSTEEAIKEIQNCEAAINQCLTNEAERHLYQQKKWMRPPMGELSYQVSQWLIQEGYTVVRWSAGWDKMQRGDIVLLHEQDPIAELPKKLERLEEIMDHL